LLLNTVLLKLISFVVLQSIINKGDV
jgi:hypothetical protein